VTEMLKRASVRETVSPSDGKSTSTFERVSIDGQRYFLKQLSPATDWVMRVTGDRVHRPYRIWQAGVMDRIPSCIDHTVVAMEVVGDGDAHVFLKSPGDATIIWHTLRSGSKAALKRNRQGEVTLTREAPPH